jgi:hypothetical protein
MPRRRSTTAIEIAYGGAPVPCPICDGASHRYALAMWPVTWQAICLGCGLSSICTAAPAVAQKPQRPPEDPSPRTWDTGWLP